MTRPYAVDDVDAISERLAELREERDTPLQQVPSCTCSVSTDGGRIERIYCPIHQVVLPSDAELTAYWRELGSIRSWKFAIEQMQLARNQYWPLSSLLSECDEQAP
jgi:hypothetical protein